MFVIVLVLVLLPAAAAGGGGAGAVAGGGGSSTSSPQPPKFIDSLTACPPNLSKHHLNSKCNHGSSLSCRNKTSAGELSFC